MLSDILTKEGADVTYACWCFEKGRYHLIRDRNLEDKVKETLQSWREKTIEQTLSGEAPDLRKKERLSRKAANTRRRKQEVARLTSESLYNSGSASPCMNKVGYLKGLALSLGTLAALTCGSVAS